MRTILHSDLNNFYASVEILKHPELADKPLIVTGNKEDRHGVVLAKNAPAKRAGIKTGDVLWQAKKKCKNLIEVPADFSSSEIGGNEDWIEVPPEDMPSDLPDDWALPVGGEFEPEAFFEASATDGFAPVAEELAPAAAGPAQSGAAEPQADDDLPF